MVAHAGQSPFLGFPLDDVLYISVYVYIYIYIYWRKLNWQVSSVPSHEMAIWEWEWISYSPASLRAAWCKKSLELNLWQQDWSWGGLCPGCKHHYASGCQAVSCMNSKPKAVGGVTLNHDKDLSEMLCELGAAALLAYFGQTDWDWGPNSQTLCPRCNAFGEWMCIWKDELVERLRHAPDHMHDIDDALDELSRQVRHVAGTVVLDDDVLFSRRLRAIVQLLLKFVGSGSPMGAVAVVVPWGCSVTSCGTCFVSCNLSGTDRLKHHPGPPTRCLKHWSGNLLVIKSRHASI